MSTGRETGYKAKPITKKWASYYIPVISYSEMLKHNKVYITETMFKYIEFLDLFKEERKAGLLICAEKIYTKDYRWTTNTIIPKEYNI